MLASYYVVNAQTDSLRGRLVALRIAIPTPYPLPSRCMPVSIIHFTGQYSYYCAVSRETVPAVKNSLLMSIVQIHQNGKRATNEMTDEIEIKGFLTESNCKTGSLSSCKLM